MTIGLIGRGVAGGGEGGGGEGNGFGGGGLGVKSGFGICCAEAVATELLTANTAIRTAIAVEMSFCMFVPYVQVLLPAAQRNRAARPYALE